MRRVLWAPDGFQHNAITVLKHTRRITFSRILYNDTHSPDDFQHKGGEGYGPFSATARRQPVSQIVDRPPCREGIPDEGTNVSLGANLNLRLSLANLPHPMQLDDIGYQSPAWKLAMVRLYRTILRLHNKVIAVSVSKATMEGPAEAVSAITGVRTITRVDKKEAHLLGINTVVEQQLEKISGEAKDPTNEKDYLLRYLLTTEQREFGNRFVQAEFRRHIDADATYSKLFFQSWYDYILQLSAGITARDLVEKEKRLLTDEQKSKLNELRSAVMSIRATHEPGYGL